MPIDHREKMGHLHSQCTKTAQNVCSQAKAEQSTVDWPLNSLLIRSLISCRNCQKLSRIKISMNTYNSL